MEFDNNYITVDLDQIAANYQAIREKAGVPAMAIVKADAYGHGAIQVARVLEKDCDFFGVSSLAEALELRKAGITAPILVLGPLPQTAFEIAVREQIRPTIDRYEDGEALSQVAEKLGVTAPFHLAVDTGMSRIGFQATEENADVCAKLCALPGIAAEGIFSHYATADNRDLTKARAQADRFDRFCQMLEQRGVTVQYRHMDNSAGIANFARHYQMVRPGIVLYGMYPSPEVDPAHLPVQPALNWKSRITHIKTLEAGREISYGGAFVTEKPTVVATIPVGYADGYRRALSNRFYVLIRGKKAPILGRVCMDQMMVDVTEIPNAQVGDTVTLVGTDGDERITMEEIATAADVLHYEFSCGISRRVPRYYLLKGEIVRKVHYLLDNV